jgi:hypothetical protein
MNEQIIKKCIKKNELQLNFWDKIAHYWIVIFALIIPVSKIFFKISDVINKTEKPSREGEIYLFIIPVLLSILFYALQKKRLRFKVVETKLNISQIYKVVDETAQKLDWIINKRENTYLTASTNPKYISGSWGEQITIIFTENKVLINSICDLNKRTSLVSMGRNKNNEQTFIKNIQKASH